MSGLSLSFAAVAGAVEGGGGFNPFEFAQGATFWTVVIFLLALLPMWKFVFGPITAALDERDRKVDEALAAAERARREAEEQTAATRSELEKARAEAKAMVDEATSRAERQAEAELARARSEAERQLQQARQEIEAQKQKALEDIRREVVDLAVGSAAAVLGRSVEGDDNRRIVDEFLSQAGGAGR
jgi:F-type H+-transporting ATPase subunit b